MITPREMEYTFSLLFDDRTISILAYNLETVLAEKLETVLSRNIANTRPRDYYDVHILYALRGAECDKSTLRRVLAYFISEHDPIWGWVIGLNEMFKNVEREDDIIANEEKVFDGFLRTINTEILGADLIDVGLILRALTVETLFVKIKVHLTKRFFILTERSFACNVFSCTF